MSEKTVNQRKLAWAALFVALVLYALFQVTPLLKMGGGHANDFKHIYLGSMLLWEGENPYDAQLLMEMGSAYMEEDPRFTSGILPYVYLPFTGMVLGPLTSFDFAVAVIVWQLINHLLFIAGLSLAAYAAKYEWNWKTIALITAATIFNYTIFRQNTAGQLNMMLVFGYGLLFLSIVREWKPWTQGLIAAALMLFKITPGIFLIYFLLRGRWKQAIWMMVFAIALTIPPVLLFGFDTHLAFLPLLKNMGFGESTWAVYGQTFWRDPYNQSINSLLHRMLVTPQPGSDPSVAPGTAAANLLTWVAALGLLAAFAWTMLRPHFLLRTKTVRDSPSPPLNMDNETPLFSLAILSSLLIPSLMWDHYLVQALIPTLLLWKSAETLCHHKWRPYVRLIIAFCVLVISLGVEFSAGFIHFGILETFLSNFMTPPRFPTIPFPQFCGMNWIAAGLKLWPVLILFALACFLAKRADYRTVFESGGGNSCGNP